MTNKNLKKLFDYLNNRFFEGRIQGYQVRFEDLEDGDEGDCSCGDRLIRIDKHFQSYIDFTTVILLHEMAHADLPMYVGNTGDEAHGTLFQGKISDLIRAGAYDGLL